jgi:hypothetical protein
MGFEVAEAGKHLTFSGAEVYIKPNGGPEPVIETE